MDTLGSRLKFAREHADLKQVDVMKITKISNTSLSHWEKDIARPDPESLKILSELYKVSANSLLGIDNNIVQKSNNLLDLKRILASSPVTYNNRLLSTIEKEMLLKICVAIFEKN